MYQKFQTSCQKSSKLFLYLSGVLITMNIFVVTNTPDYFISKFNLFLSEKVYLFEVTLIAGLCLQKKFKLDKIDLFTLLIIITNPYITNLQKSISLFAILTIKQNQIRLIFKGIKHGIIINLIPAFFQLINK